MRKAIIAILLLCLCVVGLWRLSKAHSFQLFGQAITHFETQQPMVALTFDDGPSKAFTHDVLRILEKQDVRATFFVTGKEAQKNKSQIQAIVDAGHDLGNHSFTHRRMVLMSPRNVRREITDTDAAIRAAGFDGAITFRPPFGSRLFVLPWVLSQDDRLTVMWNVAPDRDPATTPEDMVKYTVENAGSGAIILLHPMYSTRETTRAALADIIKGLRAKGLEPVPVSRLLADTNRDAQAH